MPATTSDALDEQLASDGFPSFDGGMVSAPAAKLLQPNQAALIENMTIDTEGRLCTRPGVSMYYLDNLSPSGPPSLPAYVWSVTTANASVVLVGVQSFYSGANPWGIPTGWYRRMFVAPAIGGDANKFLLAGSDGLLPDIDNGPLATALGLDGLYFSQTGIPLMLYKGLGNGTVLTEYNTAPVGGTVTNAPPRGNGNFFHQGRLGVFGGSGLPDTINFSNIFDVSTFNLATGGLRIGDGDQDAVLQCTPWIDTALVVWKKRSIWILDADPTTTPANWGVRCITRRLGILGPFTAAAVNGDIWALTTDGVRSIGRLFGTEQTVSVGDPLSQPVRDYINRITPGAERVACAAYYRGRYFLSIPIDGSQTNNCLLVWRDISESWEGLWKAQNLNVASMCIDNTQSPPALLMGLTNGSIVQWKDYVPENARTDDTFTDYLPDAGFSGLTTIPVVARLRTRASVMQDFLARKRGYLLDIEFYKSKSRTVQVYAIVDAGAPILIATVDSRNITTPDVTLTTNLTWTLGADADICRRTVKYKPAGRWRECQFELRATDGKYLCVSNMVATAFMESYRMQQ